MASENKYDFSKILEKTNNVLASQGQPTLRRTLPQLGSVVRKLAPKPEVNTEIGAQLFFASKGLDLAKHASALRTMPLMQTPDTMEPVDELDVDRFLEHQHELLISSAVEECSKLNAISFRQALIGQIEDDWDVAKRDILESMSFPLAGAGGSGSSSIGSNSGLIDYTASTSTAARNMFSFAAGPSVHGGAGASSDLKFSPSSAGALTAEQAEYVNALASLNELVKRETHDASIKTGFGYNASASSSSSLSSVAEIPPPLSGLDVTGAFLHVAQGLEDAVKQRAQRAGAAAAAAGGGMGMLMGANAAAGMEDLEAEVDAAASVVDTWSLLLLQVRELANASSSFTHDVDSSVSGSAAGISNVALARKAALARGALAFLEQSFRFHVETEVRDSDVATYGVAAVLSGQAGHTEGDVAASVDAYLKSAAFRGRFVSHDGSALDGASSGGLGAGGDVVGTGAGALSLTLDGPRNYNVDDPVRLVAGDLSWARLYLCLRCGDVEAAVAVARAAVSRGAPAQTLLQSLEQRLNGQDPGALWNALQTEYTREHPATSDPFRVAVYHVVGRFKLDSAVQRDRINRYVAINVEDYLWLKLSVAWLSAAPMPAWLHPKENQNTVSLEYLQLHILKLGEAHFSSPGSPPFLYARVLLMTQQFEQAVFSLLRTSPVLAVNLCVALHASGLIHCAPADAELLIPRKTGLASSTSSSSSSTSSASSSSSSSSSLPTAFALNVTRILQRYADSVAGQSPVSAFHYLYYLKDVPVAAASAAAAVRDDAHRVAELFAQRQDVQSLVSLLCQSRDVTALVGTTRGPLSDVVVMRGPVLAMYTSQEASFILSTAADRLVTQGKWEVAVDLYSLAGLSGRVSQTLLQFLSRVATAREHEHERTKLMSSCNTFLSKYGGHATLSNADADTVAAIRSLATLRDLVEFFTFYHQGRFDAALSVIAPLGLLPDADDVASSVQLLKTFEALDPLIKRLYGPLVLAVMDLLRQQYLIVVQDRYADPQLVTSIRARARALLMFVVTHPLEGIGHDLRAKLAKIEEHMP